MELKFEDLCTLFIASLECVQESETELKREYFRGQCDLLAYFIRTEKEALGIEKVCFNDTKRNLMIEL